MRPIGVVAVLGAGVMGNGIAHVAALAGYRVILRDVGTDYLDAAWKRIRHNMERQVEHGELETDRAAEALARIALTTAMEEVAPADLVIEAVPEVMELKKDVFRQLGLLCSEEAIFASNTSTMSITEMAAEVPHPERVAGMHFTNPVHRMKLVELVRAYQTSEETLEVLRDVAARMGKETITVNEAPGFASSRLGVALGNEAMRMLEQGVASAADIDKAMRLGYGHHMGPLETADLVGLDTRLRNTEYLYQELGDPQFRPPLILKRLVRAGKLGRKTGEGFYRYDEHGRRIG